jgi:hypothetical protein
MRISDEYPTTNTSSPRRAGRRAAPTWLCSEDDYGRVQNRIAFILTLLLHSVNTIGT